MSKLKGIQATYMRSKKTMRKYIEYFNSDSSDMNPFQKAREDSSLVIKEFDHWLIINNNFPYDAIAITSHMILPKRQFSFDWKLMNKDEREEFDNLKGGYLSKNYDAIYENLPSGQSVPIEFHLHLLKLKRTNAEEFMNQ